MNHVADILSAVRMAIGKGDRHLQSPRLIEKDAAGVATLNLSDVYVSIFADELKKITRAAHAVPLSSGTAALQLALIAAGVRQGDEVLCPSLTFAATANAIVHAGGVPHFVDSREYDLGVNPFKLRQYLGTMDAQSLSRIKALIAVHLLGIPCAVHELHSICAHHGIALVEDAAEALGSQTVSGHCGVWGRAGTLSFNLNKIVTTGGGGAVLTNDEAIAQRVRHLATQAKVAHPFLWQHDEIGFNYRMNPLGAALGTAQLWRLGGTLRAKRALAHRYAVALNETESVKPVSAMLGNCWLNAALIDPRFFTAKNGDKPRDDALTALLAEGFEARALFTPLHMLPHFAHCPRQPSLASAEDLFKRCVCLPSTVGGET